VFVVVSYDVSTMDAAGRRRLRKVAKACESFGQRVQNSVFECLVDNESWTRLKHRLLDEVDLEQDSLRFYYLGKNYKRNVEHHGIKEVPDLEAPLVL
jgi:CRISPR-associated protein Cas2